MLGQSKTFHQAEIDAACELADFFRYNAHFAEQIFQTQPASPAGEFNMLDHRGLEGFVLAITRSTSPPSVKTCRPSRP